MTVPSYICNSVQTHLPMGGFRVAKRLFVVKMMKFCIKMKLFTSKGGFELIPAHPWPHTHTQPTRGRTHIHNPPMAAHTYTQPTRGRTHIHNPPVAAHSPGAISTHDAYKYMEIVLNYTKLTFFLNNTEVPIPELFQYLSLSCFMKWHLNN